MKVILPLFIISAVFSSLTFNLTNKRPRCYIEELFSDSVAMVKWKLYNLPAEEDKKKSKSI